jgi:hypothetical protein
MPTDLVLFSEGSLLDHSFAGRIPAWAACVIRVSCMDSYTVWRFWLF